MTRRIVLIILLIGSITSGLCIGEDLNSVMDRKIDSFEIDNVTALEAITKFIAKCKPLNILITFEEAVNTKEDNLITIKLKNVSVRNLIDEITSKSKSYVWKQDGNVINIIPSNKKNDTNYILNEKIHHLVIKDKTREEIVDMVLEMINQNNPGKYKIENSKGITENELILIHLSDLPYKDIGLSSPVLKKYNIEIKYKNVREILNLIAKEENVPWYVMLHKKKEDNIRILFFGGYPFF